MRVWDSSCGVAYRGGGSQVWTIGRILRYSAFPREGHSRVFERRLQPTVKPRSQEQQCGFLPGHTGGPPLNLLRPAGGGLGICGSGESLCPFSPILVSVYMDIILRHNQCPTWELQDYVSALWRWCVMCDVWCVRMKHQEWGSDLEIRDHGSPLENSGLLALGSGGLLLLAIEFNDLGVLYTSDRRMEREMDRWFVDVSMVMHALYWIIVGKKDLLLFLRCDPHLW